jgi:hypothetical protein
MKHLKKSSRPALSTCILFFTIFYDWPYHRHPNQLSATRFNNGVLIYFDIYPKIIAAGRQNRDPEVHTLALMVLSS